MDFIQSILLAIFVGMLSVSSTIAGLTLFTAFTGGTKRYSRKLRNTELDWLKRRWRKGRPLLNPPYGVPTLNTKEAQQYDPVAGHFAAIRNRWASLALSLPRLASRSSPRPLGL